MTSTPGSDPHPEVAEISDLTEGLLTAERAAQVGLHLVDCELCSDVLVSLTEISELLGALPAAEPMPADVAGRIDAALAVEAGVSGSARADLVKPATAEPVTRTDAAASVDAPRDDVPHAGVPRGTPADAPSTPSALSGVPRGTPSGPSGRPGASTGPGRARRTAGRRRLAGIAAGWTVGALALGGIVYAVAEAGDGSAGSDSSASVKGAGSPPPPGSVEDQVRRLLTEPDSSVQPNGGSVQAPNHDTGPMIDGTGTGTAPTTGQGHGVADVPRCVLQATHRTQAPLAVGRDQYQGAASYLVVLPHPSDTTLVDAFVVNASCSGSTAGSVLFQAVYQRP